MHTRRGELVVQDGYLAQIKRDAARRAAFTRRPTQPEAASLEVPAFAHPIGNSRKAVPQLNGFGFTNDEQDRIREMFLIHSRDNVMTQVDFNNFLVEAFAYSFTTREAALDCRQHIRASIGQLAAKIDTTSPIFTQAWRYFDKQQNDVLTLRQVGAGLSTVTRAADASKFIFALADVNENNSLSHDEVLEFFKHFIELVLTLGLGVLALEQAFLITNDGWDADAVAAQRGVIENTMNQVQQRARAELDQPLTACCLRHSKLSQTN